MPHVSIVDLTTLVASALRASGATESQAHAAAKYLVAADAQGLATHGVARVPLGWRSVNLTWEDGHWWFHRSPTGQDWWRVRYW